MTQSPTVLLIDDVADTRKGIADLLHRRGYSTLEAESAKQGLRLLRANSTRVSVIVLDLLMPSQSGWWFREQQLADPTIAAIPAIVFTGAGRPELVKYTLKVEEVLFKPTSVDDLFASIARLAPVPA